MYEYTFCSSLVFSNPILLTFTKFETSINYSLSLPMIADAWQTGVWKGLFLGLPLSVAHILIWRTAFFDNWKLAFCGVVGKCIGELLLILSIILGWRNLFQIWYMVSPFLMFFSVSYIMFVTTFDGSQKVTIPFSPNFNPKTRVQYVMGFLSHLFLAITQQTYVCHRLSNIAIDWDDKIPFGSFFKTSQGYIDQIIPGTTFSFCLGLIAGYTLITIIWFYFGTFILTTFFSTLYRLVQSPKYFVERYEDNSGSFINRDYPWFIQFYYMRFKPVLRRAKLNVAFLIKVLIYGLTWAHVFHCSPSYISAEGFQLVSQYFDSKIINSAYERKIPKKVDSSIRPIIKKIAKTRRKDSVSLLKNSPQLKEYEEQLSKKGGLVFGDRIYSQQLLTRFGPYAPIGKYGDKWGWGEHIIGQRRRDKLKPSPNVEVASLLEKIELFQKIRFYIKETSRNITSFLDLIATELEDELILKPEKDPLAKPGRKSRVEETDGSTADNTVWVENQELFMQDQRSRGFETQISSDVEQRPAGVDYYAFVARQQAKSMQLNKSPWFRPSLNFINIDLNKFKVKKEKTKEELKKEKLEKEDLEDIKKSRTSREIQLEEEKEKLEGRFKDPQFEAIQDRFNIWGLRRVIENFIGVDDSMIELFDDDDEGEEYISEYIKSVNELKNENHELLKEDPSTPKEKLKKKANKTRSDIEETESELESELEAESEAEESFIDEVSEDYSVDEDTDLEDDDFEDELEGENGEKKEETPEQKKKRFKKTERYLLNRLAKQNLQILTTFPLRTQVSYFPSQQLYPEIKQIEKNQINEDKQIFNEFNFDDLKQVDRRTKRIVNKNRNLKLRQKSVMSHLIRNKPRRRGVKKSTLLDVAARKPLFAIALLDKTASVDNIDSFMFNEYRSFKPFQRVSGNFVKAGIDKMELETPEDEPIRTRRLNLIDAQEAQSDLFTDSELDEESKDAEEKVAAQLDTEQIMLQKEKEFKDSVAIPSSSVISFEYSHSALTRLQNFSQELALRASERKLDLSDYFKKKRTMESFAGLELFKITPKKTGFEIKNKKKLTGVIPPYINKYKPLAQKEIVKRINESPTFKIRTTHLNRSLNFKQPSRFFNYNFPKGSDSSLSVLDRKLNKKFLVKLENTQNLSDWDFWRTQSFSKIWQGMRQNFVSKSQKHPVIDPLPEFSAKYDYNKSIKNRKEISPYTADFFESINQGTFGKLSEAAKKPSFILPPKDKDSKTFEPALNPSDPQSFAFVRGPGGRLDARTRKDLSLDYNRDISGERDKAVIKFGNTTLLSIESQTYDPPISDITNGRPERPIIRFDYEILSLNPRKQIKRVTDPISRLVSKGYSKIGPNPLYISPKSAISSLYTPNPEKKKRIYFYNAALFFSDCYYTGKFLQLPGIKKTDENLNERRSGYLMYWISRSSEVALKPVLFKLFRKKKSVEEIRLPENSFFVRSLDKPSDFEEDKEEISRNSSYLNAANFETERRYHKYQKSPLYRALLSYNVSCMLNHELPSTVLHNSLNKKEIESIRQKIFIYYQTRHLNNLNGAGSNFQDISSPIFNGIALSEDNQNFKGPKFIDPSKLVPFAYSTTESSFNELNNDFFEAPYEALDEKLNVTKNENNNTEDNEIRTVDEVENLEGVTGIFQPKSKGSLLNTSALSPRHAFPLKEKMKTSFDVDIDQEFSEENNDSSSEFLTVDEVKMIDQLTDSYIFNPEFFNSKVTKSLKALPYDDGVDDEESDSLDTLLGFFSKLFGEENIDTVDLPEENDSVDENSVEIDQNPIDSTLILDNRIQIPMPSFIRDKFEQSSRLLNHKNQVERQEWSNNSSSSILKSQVLSQLAKRENYFTRIQADNKQEWLKPSRTNSKIPVEVPSIKTLNSGGVNEKLHMDIKEYPSSYPITIKIVMPKKLKKESKVRFIFDTLPLRTNVLNFTNKKIGLIQNVSGAPLRTFSTKSNARRSNKFSAFNSINTIWKPSIFAGPNLRELPIQATSLAGGIIPIHNRVSSRAVSSKNIWNLNGVTFNGEKNQYRSPGPYRLGPFSFEPTLGSQLLHDLTNESDKTLLPFLEDFWAAKLRLETYDSWLNVLPSTSTDPLYLKARDTVIRLRHSQKIRIQRLAFEQKWYLEKIADRILNTSFDIKQRAKFSASEILQTKQNFEFLKSYLNSFGFLSAEDDLKIASYNFEMETDSSLLVPETLITFLQTDKRYKPWYHEEIKMPKPINSLLYDPYANLTNLFLLRQDDLFPNIFSNKVLIKDLEGMNILIDQEYILKAKYNRNKKSKSLIS